MKELQPAVSDLAQFTKGQFELLPALDLFNRCQLNVILPTGDARIDDGALLDRAAQLPGVLPDDGRARRASRRTSTATARTPASMSGGGGFPVQTAVAQQSEVPALRRGDLPTARHPPGARRRKPPYKPNAPCYKQKPPNLNAAQIGAGPVRRQIRKQMRVFVAIIFLLVGALAVASYILSQRALLPAGLGAADRHQLLRGQGRAADRPGGRARPGAVGEHRRGEDRRGRRRPARERPRGRDDADPGQVQADLPRRQRADAAQDRPEGHVPGARPGHQADRRAARGRSRAGCRTRCPTSTATRSWPSSTPTRAPTSRSSSARAGPPSTTTRPAPTRASSRPPSRTCARCSSASSRRPRTASRSRGQLIARRHNIKRVIHNFQLLSTALAQARRPAGRLRRLRQRELRGLRLGGVVPARGAARVPRRALADRPPR